MIATRSVHCGVSSREVAPINRSGALRSQWCTAARFTGSRLAQAGPVQQDASRHTSASVSAASPPCAPPPVAFRNAVNAGIKKAVMPVPKVLHCWTLAITRLYTMYVTVQNSFCTFVGFVLPQVTEKARSDMHTCGRAQPMAHYTVPHAP